MASRRGFASVSPERLHAIASAGGKEAHARGTAHRFSSEEAVAAGKKGQAAMRARRAGQVSAAAGKPYTSPELQPLGSTRTTNVPGLEPYRCASCGIELGQVRASHVGYCVPCERRKKGLPAEPSNVVEKSDTLSGDERFQIENFSQTLASQAETNEAADRNADTDRELFGAHEGHDDSGDDPGLNCHSVPCDKCDGSGFYLINGEKQRCICSEPQS